MRRKILMQSPGVRTYRKKTGSIDVRIPRHFLGVLILMGYGSVLVSAPAVVGSPSPRSGLAQDSAKPDTPSVAKESPGTIRLTQEVLQEAVQLQKKYPDRIDPIYLQGMTYFRMGNSTEAEKHWRKCLEMNPKYAVAYTSLAGIKADTSQYEEALALYRKGLSLYPEDPQVVTNIGVALLYLSRFDEAIQTLQENLKKHPQEKRTHIYLGKAYQQRKEYAKAKFHFVKALPVFPDNKSIYYGLARVYTRLGEKDKAASARKKFSELSSRHIEQTLEKRYEHYDDAAILKKNVAELYVQIGICYQLYGDIAQTERLWKKSAAHDAQNTACRRLLAVLYQKTNRNRDALTWYQELCKLDPKNPGYFLHRGALSAQFGDTRSAESAFQAVIQLAPGHPEGYRSLIMLYIQTKQKPQEAKKLATTLVQKSPTALDYFLLARTCVLRGEYPQARQALEKAMDLDPENEMYKMLFEEISR